VQTVLLASKWLKDDRGTTRTNNLTHIRRLKENEVKHKGGYIEWRYFKNEPERHNSNNSAVDSLCTTNKKVDWGKKLHQENHATQVADHEGGLTK